VLDQWQAQQMAQRLNRRGVPVQLVTMESSRMDRLITLLKGTFSKRLVRIPAHEALLIEQLESVQVVESRIGKRDTLKFAPSGVGASAGLHDDHVVALALGLEVLESRVGKLVMDPMPHGCNLQKDGRLSMVSECYLAGGMYLPPRQQPSCQACPGHQSVVRAIVAHQARTGEYIEPRQFVREQRIAPNAFIQSQRFTEWFRNYR